MALFDVGVFEQAGQAVARQGVAQQPCALCAGEYGGDQGVIGNGLGDEIIAGFDQAFICRLISVSADR